MCFKHIFLLLGVYVLKQLPITFRMKKFNRHQIHTTTARKKILITVTSYLCNRLMTILSMGCWRFFFVYLSSTNTKFDVENLVHLKWHTQKIVQRRIQIQQLTSIKFTRIWRYCYFFHLIHTNSNSQQICARFQPKKK